MENEKSESMAQTKLLFYFVGALLLLKSGIVLATGATLPDTSTADMTKFTAAGTLMGIVDSFLFSIGARLLAGVAILGAAWNLKEQRFAMAIICIFAAVMMGTIPMWVKNIFSLDSNAGSIFSGG